MKLFNAGTGMNFRTSPAIPSLRRICHIPVVYQLNVLLPDARLFLSVYLELRKNLQVRLRTGNKLFEFTFSKTHL